MSALFWVSMKLGEDHAYTRATDWRISKRGQVLTFSLLALYLPTPRARQRPDPHHHRFSMRYLGLQ